MPLSTWITGTSSAYEPVLYLRIEGVPYAPYATRQPTWGLTSGAAFRKGLLLPSADVSLAIDIITGMPRAGGMTFEFQDDADNFFSTLFSSGRWDNDANMAYSRIRSPGIDRDDAATIPVDSAAAFNGVTFPADFNVGNETVLCSGKDNGANTLTISASGRGRFSAFSPAYSYDHVPDSQTGLQPLITAPKTTATIPAPYTWIGRWVGLYVNYYDHDAGTFGSESESVLVWAGRIRSKNYTDRDTWELQCTHAMDEIGREVFRRLGSSTVRGYTLRSSAAPHSIIFVRDSETTSPITYRATATLTAGVYADWDALAAEINSKIATLTFKKVTDEATTLTRHASVSLEVDGIPMYDGSTFSAKGVPVLSVYRDTAALTDAYIQYNVQFSSPELAAVFGLEPGRMWRPVNADHLSTTAAAVAEPSVCVSVLPPPAAILAAPGPNDLIPVQHTDAFTVPQTTDPADTKGYVIVQGKFLVHVDQLDSANRTIRAVGAVNYPRSGTVADSSFVLVQPSPNAEPIRIQQVFFRYESAVNFLVQLFLSTGTYGYADATRDVLARGHGLAIPAALVDDDQIAGYLPQYITEPNRWYYIDKSLRAEDLIRPETTLFSFGFTFRPATGKIGVVSLGDLSLPPGTPTVSLAHRPERNDVLVYEEGVDTIVNRVRIQIDQDKSSGGAGWGATIELNERVSQDAFGEVRAVTIDHPYLRAEALSDAFNQTLGDLLVNKIRRFNRPWPTVRFEYLRGLYDLYPGQIVAVTDSRLPDPFSGARGVTTLPARIISTRFDWKEMRGEATAIIEATLLPDRKGVICPAARVSSRSAGAPDDTLTLVQNDFTAAPDRDVDLFDVGDAIRVVERNPTDPASPQVWSRTIVTKTASTNKITVATLAGYDAGKTYLVEFDAWATAGATQRNGFAFQGDATTKLIQSSGKTYYWT